MQTKRRLIAISVPLLILISLTTAGCGAAASPTGPAKELAMASMEGMPDDVKAAPVVVQQAYQFVVANPDVMSQIPCYCGCGKMGHKSNYACYAKDAGEKGELVFDTHALGCSICVDITQDVMRLTREGKSAQGIRAYVDATYSKYGPSNMVD